MRFIVVAAVQFDHVAVVRRSGSQPKEVPASGPCEAEVDDRGDAAERWKAGSSWSSSVDQATDRANWRRCVDVGVEVVGCFVEI